MKIDCQIFQEFIRKASLDGRINTINLYFSELGVKSNVKDATDVCLTITTLSKNAFIDYIAFGEVYIKNSTQFLKYLKSFAGTIDIKKTATNILVITSERREISIILGTKMVCDNLFEGDIPAVETTTEIALNKKELNASLKDASDISSKVVVLRKTKTEMTIEVGEKLQTDFIINKLALESFDNNEAVVKIGDSIYSLYNSLSGSFSLRMGTDMPIVVKENTEFIEFNCLIAPIKEE